MVCKSTLTNHNHRILNNGSHWLLCNHTSHNVTRARPIKSLSSAKVICTYCLNVFGQTNIWTYQSVMNLNVIVSVSHFDLFRKSCDDFIYMETLCYMAFRVIVRSPWALLISLPLNAIVIHRVILYERVFQISCY